MGVQNCKSSVSESSEAQISSQVTSLQTGWYLLAYTLAVFESPSQQFFSHVGMGLPGLNQYITYPLFKKRCPH